VSDFRLCKLTNGPERTIQCPGEVDPRQTDFDIDRSEVLRLTVRKIEGEVRTFANLRIGNSVQQQA
jgi:hypothetical protein